jgi:hypothetical protein
MRTARGLYAVQLPLLGSNLTSKMKRRTFLRDVAIVATTTSSLPFHLLHAAETPGGANNPVPGGLNASVRSDWLSRWEKNILGDSRNRYCDKETGEELGWRG